MSPVNHFFPISIIGLIRFVNIFLSLAYLGITVYKEPVFGTSPGCFIGLMFAIVLFSGGQLLSPSIIGKCILRIFFQVKQRPLYMVESQMINGKVAHE